MNAETIAALCQINTDFYRNQCASFSETRNHPWPGWQQCLTILAADCPDEWLVGCEEFSVLDVACGNLRFERFLASAFPQAKINVYAVDNCDDLVSAQRGMQTELQVKATYQSLDIMEILRRGVGRENTPSDCCCDNIHPAKSSQIDTSPLQSTLPLASESRSTITPSLAETLIAPTCDLTVSFGFMHHIPSTRYREEVLASLIEKTRSGGYVAVSFWQFLNNEALAMKAGSVHEQAKAELALPELEEGDYLLGWKNTPGAYRYCHHFRREEISQLAASVARRAEIVARFSADGRTGNLNSYLVFRVK